MIELINPDFLKFFSLACLAWSVHRIMIAGIKIILEKIQDEPVKIPEIFLCGRCFSFWVSLIVFLNPIIAAVVAVLVQLIESVFVYLGSKTPIK